MKKFLLMSIVALSILVLIGIIILSVGISMTHGKSELDNHNISKSRFDTIMNNYYLGEKLKTTSLCLIFTAMFFTIMCLIAYWLC